ncbi:MAG: bacillithiol system redox-active protein YtxJ [Bacteroidota bacterium]
MDWTEVNTIDKIDELRAESEQYPVLLFKHSTRCPISSMVLDRIERSWNQAEVGSMKPYILDLIKNREISNLVAKSYGVPHESPQVIILKDGQAVYDDSHMGINFQDLKEFT